MSQQFQWQTAEGALNEVSKLLIDMRQRAVAAANIGLMLVIWPMHLRKRLRMPWMPLIGFPRILICSNLVNGVVRLDGSDAERPLKSLLLLEMPKPMLKMKIRQMTAAKAKEISIEAAEAVEKTDDNAMSDHGIFDQKVWAFQVGANKGQMVSVDLTKCGNKSTALGVENNSRFNSLADLMTTGQGAQDAMSGL